MNKESINVTYKFLKTRKRKRKTLFKSDWLPYILLVPVMSTKMIQKKKNGENESQMRALLGAVSDGTVATCQTFTYILK